MKIKHILADGRQLETLKGYTLPYNGTTETAYRLLAELLRGGGAVEQQETKQRLEAYRGAEAAETAAAY